MTVILQVQSEEHVTGSDYLDDLIAALSMIILSDLNHLVMCVGTHTHAHTDYSLYTCESLK